MHVRRGVSSNADWDSDSGWNVLGMVKIILVHAFNDDCSVGAEGESASIGHDQVPSGILLE